MDNEATLTHLYEQRRDLIRRLNTVEEQITKRLIHVTEPDSLSRLDNKIRDLHGDAA